MNIKKETKLKMLIAISVVIIASLLLWFVLSGDNRGLLKSLIINDYSNEELRDRLNDFGVRGYVTIIVSSMLQVVCTFLPAEPTQVLAGLTFGFPVGLLCCAVGVFLGSTTIFLTQRLCGDAVRNYFTKKMSLDTEKISRSKRISAIVFILFLLPAIPYGIICFFAAGTGMKYKRFSLITFLGSLPSICIGVGLGHISIAYSWVLSLVLLCLLIILLICVYLRREKLLSWLSDFALRTENLSRTTVQKENGFILNVLYNALKVYFFFRGIKVHTVNRCERPLEEPSIVICNHGSFLDFYYAERLLIKKRPHFVSARLYFYHKQLGWLLRKLGCFPKSMFAMDIESTKNCLRVLQSGKILAMMPEARLSTVGRFEDIQETTYLFLKKSKVPVYTIKLQGDYFADPKWGKGIRRGSLIEAELDILFTSEQIKSLSVEEIKKGVEERLYYDEFEWLKNRPYVRYKSRKLAEGLENILTLCPVCNEKHTVFTKGNEIFCKNCGNLTAIDNRYAFKEGFRFLNFAEWYYWQKDVLTEQISNDENFYLESAVELRLPGIGKGLTRFGGNGVCRLDRSGLRYTGLKDGERVDIHYPLKQVYRLLFGAGQNFEIYNGTEIMYFIPEIKQSSVDWYMTSMILYDEMQAKTDLEGALL